MKPMIACCGLVCTDCPAYKATQANDVALAQATARQWSEQFHVEVKVEHVWCDGCVVEGKKCAHCGKCEIRACAIKRKVATCAACGEFDTCSTLSSLHAMMPAAKETLGSLRG
ncbi:MAG: DUF3795 domain-containing protein [Deltaproteobacteria bacterium]|nr:DUF3795 domain-containing protein [Deltaproteobacteria bacterium]